MFPLISARETLRLFPLQLRFFVVALVALALFAPTFHVCALGGHSQHANQAAHGAHFAPISTSGERQAAICVCAPKQNDAPIFVLSQGPLPCESESCLALLLQTMPHVLAHTAPFVRLETLREIRYQAPHFSLGSRFFALYNGRAPPVFSRFFAS